MRLSLPANGSPPFRGAAERFGGSTEQSGENPAQSANIAVLRAMLNRFTPGNRVVSLELMLRNHVAVRDR